MSNNSKQYNKENYKKYWGNPKAIKDRTARNKARRKKGLKVGDKREVHHKNGKPTDNQTSNLAVVTRTYNRRDGAKKANRVKRRLVKY